MASNIQQNLTFNGNANYTGEAVNAEKCTSVSVHVYATDLDKADGTITLQQSNDGVNFANVATATTIAANSTVYIIPSTVAVCAYYRIVWDKGTNAAAVALVNTKMLCKASN